MIKNSQIKEAFFVLEYLVDFNASKASQRAGYPETTADVAAWKMLKKLHVRQAIRKEIKARQTRTLITSDKVLAEMDSIAFVDIRDAYNDDGTLKNPKDFPKHLAHAISEIKVDEIQEFNRETKQMEHVGWSKTVKFNNKVKALENLGKHLGLFPDKLNIDISFKEKLAERVQKARLNSINLMSKN